MSKKREDIVDLINRNIPKYRYMNVDRGNDVSVDMRTDDFFIRVLGHLDRLDIGLAKHFDRWANSVDFSCKIPKNQREWDRMMRRLEKEIVAGNYDSSWSKTVWL